MSDHATLLRQFFQETLPIMERSLDTRDEFAALQKAVTAKGLDWGQLKALARAVAEDARRDDGTKRVDRIISKADFASAYADMLGLGAKMNENNFFSDAQRPSNRDVSTDGESSSAAASQGQAAHAGTGSETLASHEGQREGEGASVLSPPLPEADRSSPTDLHPPATELFPPLEGLVADNFPELPKFLDRRSAA